MKFEKLEAKYTYEPRLPTVKAVACENIEITYIFFKNLGKGQKFTIKFIKGNTYSIIDMTGKYWAIQIQLPFPEIPTLQIPSEYFQLLTDSDK